MLHLGCTARPKSTDLRQKHQVSQERCSAELEASQAEHPGSIPVTRSTCFRWQQALSAN
jgi:hypothetical protein